MKTFKINLTVIFIILMTSVLAPSLAEEQTEQKLSGCVCSIDEANGIIDLIPWSNKKYDYEKHQTVHFNSNTEFNLKSEELTLKLGEEEYPCPYDDQKLTARSELVGHHVEVTYNEREGKRIASLISLTYHTLTIPSYITIGGDRTMGYKAITRCSCSFAK